MRSVVVVFIAPPIEPTLLGYPRECRRLSRFLLEHLVHLLVCGVIFRTARTAIFNFDSQTDPPNGQRTPAARSFSAKRRAIVAAHHPWQPIPAEKPDQHLSDVSIRRAFHVTHQQKESRRAISHRQGQHPLSVSRVEPAFEVDRPHVIGTQCNATLSLDLRAGTRSSATPASQPSALQPIGYCPYARPRTKRVF